MEINQDIKAAVTAIRDTQIRPRIDNEQTRKYAKFRKANLYYRGVQYLSPVMNGRVIADWVPRTEDPRYSDEDNEFIRDYVINRYRDRCRKFCAVLGGKAPSLKALPLRDDDDNAMRMARIFDLVQQDIRRRSQLDSLHLDLVYGLFNYGTNWIHTIYVEDKEKHGEYPVQTGVESKVIPDVDPDTGEPIETTIDEPVIEMRPNGYVEFRMVPPIMVSHPPGVRDIRRMPWFVYEYEEYVGTLIGDYPELADLILEQAGKTHRDSYEGRRTRDITASPIYSEVTDTVIDQVTVSHIWLVPGMFHHADGDVEVPLPDGTFQTIRLSKQMMNEYPKGAKFTFIGDELVAIKAEALADVWTAAKPEMSDAIDCDGIGQDYMGIQDLINDFWNTIIETVERIAGLVVIDPHVVNPDSLRDNPSSPGSFILATPGTGAAMREGIREIKGSDLSPAVPQVVDALDKVGSEIIGITEQIYGGGQGVQTAEEARIRATQALRQLGIPWKMMGAAYAEAMWKAVRQLGLHHQTDLEIGGELISPLDLDSALVRFEAQDSMPQAFGELRESIREWLNMGPEAWGVFGITDPRNADALEQYFSIPGWKFPGVDQLRKTMAAISELREQQPMVDPNTGMESPSIPPDLEADDLGFVVQVVKLWASESSGMRTKANKPEGYRNVMLWKAAYEQVLQQQEMAAMQAQQQGGAPPPDGEGPPPPPMELPPPPEDMAGQMAPPMEMLEGVIPESPMAEALVG